MPDFQNTEGLMLYLINLFGEAFPQSAILKGGMELRLLDSPRSTNDLDYIFIPYKSKKDVVQQICELLDTVEGITYRYSMNSKCLRIVVTAGELSTQIEVNVAADCPSMPLSTASLAAATGQLSHVVRAMDSSVAMAHKLAAWNERRLVRDLYDLHFFYAFLNVRPDRGTLLGRLENVASTRRNKNPKQMTLQDLVRRLRTYLEGVTAADVNEVADYLPPNDLPGLELRLKTKLLQLCEELEFPSVS